MTALELEIERLTLALAVVERSAAKARGRQKVRDLQTIEQINQNLGLLKEIKAYQDQLSTDPDTYLEELISINSKDWENINPEKFLKKIRGYE